MKRMILAFAITLASLAQAATITDVRVSGAGPVTFGQVFAAGDMKKSDVLVGSIAGTAVPLQVDVKATHADGSVRHAIISADVPKAGTMLLNTGGKAAVSVTELRAALPTVTASATLAGVKCSATASGTSKVAWLSGAIVNEYQTVAPLVCAGVPHPHLAARFAVRQYASKSRVDVTIENAWAFEPGPQNFTYDADISIDGKSVYSKPGMVHYHHARWRKVFWDGPVVQHNTKYLIATRAVPNYDQTVMPAEKVLAAYGTLAVEPMGIGLSNSYMPMTGGNDGIGILPAWASAYVLSMDGRARNAVLATADGAGSYSMHYRDRKTDRPVTLTDHPRMTIVGRDTDAGADAFPSPGGDTSTPYTHDIAHQPSLAYLPYLVTGDYFYLEEMQFWALYDAFASNPGYRGAEQGLVIPEQLRGQAWALRALAQAAYATPDADALKPELTRITEKNIEYYNRAYSNNPVANKLGVPTNGYSIAYENETAIAPWMDDFFTSSVGHTVDLGFANARPLLEWKSKFPVGRMTAPGVCWITAAPYGLYIRDTADSPVYETFAQAYSRSLPSDFSKLACGGLEMAAAWGRTGYPMNMYPAYTPTPGDMGNIADGYMGYPANMQPALAYAADSGIANSAKAWALFQSRTVKPDYSLGQQFNIVPRVAAAPPVVAPPSPAKAGKVTTGSNVKLVKQNPLTVVFIDTATFAPVKTFAGVTATAKGAFTVSDAALVPGSTYLVIVSGKVPLDAFLVTVPK